MSGRALPMLRQSAAAPVEACGETCPFCGKHPGTECPACLGVNQLPQGERKARLEALLAARRQP